MKKLLWFSLSLCTILACCKKEDKRQYSEWYVNGNGFRTNDIRVEKGKGVHELFGKDLTNKFGLIFNLGYFPTTDSFRMNCSQQNPAWVCFAITYNGHGYYPKYAAYLHAGVLNGKGSYTLSATWFVNESQSNDSVLVHGTFNEP